jgi:uncharacterized protein
MIHNEQSILSPLVNKGKVTTPSSPYSRGGKVGLLLLLLSLFLISSAYALDLPPLQGYVNDYAGMISPQAKTILENELKAFEQTDSTQIVILTIPSLEGEVLEEFSIKVADTWKIGQKMKDNGVILLVAKQERKIRIEVGRGLEGRLTDLMAGRIIDLVIKPRFKREDFDGGFIAGVHAVIDATRGEFKVDGDHTRKREDTFSQIFMVLFLSGIILLELGSVSRILAGIAGAVAFPVFAHLIPGLPSGIITYAIAAVLGFGAGMIIPRFYSSSSRNNHRDGGYWMGRRGYGGGGFDSGGFSGGGGGFGGGGASGGW